MAGAGKFALMSVAAGAAAVAGESIHLAADFQETTTQLVTGGGESEAALGQVRQGLLKMAPAVGMGPVALAKAMFLVESAGYHGAAGLKVMQAAAEGAKIGGSDATVVADGLTTALTDYHLKASDAATITSQLVETVASGKTNMQDLAGSLHNVLPAAAAAHIGLQQVLGAMATMTGQGISADQASQDLANTIRQLQKPSQQQAAYMDQLGISVTKLQTGMGKVGLTGTMNTLVSAITEHMGPAGTVLLSTFKNSQMEAGKAKTMLDAMPASLQKVAEGYLKGTVTQKAWRAATKGMTVDQRQLAQEFAATVNRSRGFSDLLAKGGPSADTFAGALAKVTGGATGMNVALALTGANAATFATNVKNISSASTEAGGHVKGWGETQKDFNVQLSKLTAGLQVLGVKIGDFLIPKITAIVHWFTQHKTVVIALAAVIGGALVASIVAYVSKLAWGAAETVGKLAVMVAGWAGLGPAASAAAAETTAAMGEVEGAEGAMAASSEAAGEASSAAFGPIGLAIAGVVLVATLLVTHWKQVWGFIKTAVSGAWNDVIKPVFRFIMDNAIRPLIVAVQVMRQVFETVFGWIEHYAIDPLMLAAQTMKQVFDAVWGGISDAISGAWNDVIKPVFDFIRHNWGLILDVLLGGLGLLITHWRQVWGAIKDVAKAVWDDVLKPVWDAIDGGLHFIENTLATVGRGWANIWGGIETVAQDAWGVLKGIFNFIDEYAIQPIEYAIQEFGQIWSDIWGGVQSVIQDVWNIIKPIIDGIKNAVGGVVHVVSSIVSGVGGAISDVGSFLGFDTGGPVPGAPGSPMLALVHGGEYVLSTGMLNGTAPIPPGIMAAMLAGAARNTSGLTTLAAAARTPAGLPTGTGTLLHPTSTGGGGGTQVVEVHNHVYLDGKQIQHTVERRQLQAGMRRSLSYPAYLKT